MSTDVDEDSNIDSVLTEVGEFGLFQIFIYFLICIQCIIVATYTANFMISASTLDYRCEVPECDVGANNREILYNQSWLQNAIPFQNGNIDTCSRYGLRNQTVNVSNQCSAEMFDPDVKIACSSFVYASNEKNVQTEFNIHCAESYKLVLWRYHLLAFYLTGQHMKIFFQKTLFPKRNMNEISEFGKYNFRFGRLNILIIGTVVSSIFGIIKSFSFNYPMYLMLEFVESFSGASNFESAYVLSIEWVNSNYRVLGSTIVTIAFSLGEMLLGLVAMFVPDFRILSRILYTPGLFIITYWWLAPESVRWLLVNGRVDRAVKTLKRIAKVNGKELSQKSIEKLERRYKNSSSNAESQNEHVKNGELSVIQTFGEIFKTKSLRLRLMNCFYQWIALHAGYIGLSLSSTQIPGTNRYTSFIFVMSAEIPGVLLAQILLTRMKRRLLIGLFATIGAIAIIISPFIPEEQTIVVLILYLSGKATVSCAYIALFVYTAEQWPTNFRTTIMNTCLMVGRMGSMLVPLAVVLDPQLHLFPLLIGISSILVAVSVFFSPETFSKKMPDTIEEAKSS